MGTGQYSAYFVERHLRKGSKLQNMLLHLLVQEDVQQKLFFAVERSQHHMIFINT